MTDTTLYFSPQPTRCARARWAFVEAGVPFEPQSIDVFKGEQSSEAYLAVNPLGLVPAAVVDGQPMTESSAMALMVALDKSDGTLAPRKGTLQWRAMLQWVVFAPAELDHLLATLNQHLLIRPPEARDAKVVAETRQVFDRRASLLSDTLGDRPFLLGEQFSVADICVGHSIAWAQMLDLLGGFPRLREYLARLEVRPAFTEVYGGKVNVYPDPHAAAR